MPHESEDVKAVLIYHVDGATNLNMGRYWDHENPFENIVLTTRISNILLAHLNKSKISWMSSKCVLD